MSTTMKEQWEGYRDACYPLKNGRLHPRQEAELRQAYFAGCLDTFHVSMKHRPGASEIDDAQFIAGLIREVKEECDKRIKDLYGQEGRN